jgi:hypothetical protein
MRSKEGSLRVKFLTCIFWPYLGNDIDQLLVWELVDFYLLVVPCRYGNDN